MLSVISPCVPVAGLPSAPAAELHSEAEREVDRELGVRVRLPLGAGLSDRADKDRLTEWAGRDVFREEAGRVGALAMLPLCSRFPESELPPADLCC